VCVCVCVCVFVCVCVCNLLGSPPGKEAELRQVGVQAVDVHVEDVQVGVTAVVDEVAQVPVVRRVHLHENKEVISIGLCNHFKADFNSRTGSVSSATGV
jgi:hypothetical protein